jgi:DNA-binding MarR family transcriptional regulator
MRASSDDVAFEVLEVVPLIMRVIRAEMREHRAAGLSVPQFRALAYLNRYAGASLSELGDYIGLTLPSMSKLVDGLVGRRLVTREPHAADRRRVTLELTGRGHTTLESAYASTQAHLAARLAVMPEAERVTVVQAMRALRSRFAQEHGAQADLMPRGNSHS